MESIYFNEIRIYGLEESSIASGYPMKYTKLNIEKQDMKKSDHDRLVKLAYTDVGSGHACALKGITIQFDLTAPEYFWRQLDRYHFIDHISSQSKMHCIEKFNITNMCNEFVDERIIKILEEKIAEGCSKSEILSNVPGGFMLTSRMTTNALQLKTIYHQRKAHRLEEWKEFCDWIEIIFKKIELPL